MLTLLLALTACHFAPSFYLHLLPIMVKRCPPRKVEKKKGVKLGKAAVLTGPLWRLWLEFVLKQGPTWLYICLFLSHTLCCRVTEILELRSNDFNWRNRTVHVKALKRGKAMQKPMLQPMREQLLHLRKTGIQRKRTRKAGARGQVVYKDSWTWPKNGPLFPSERADSKAVTRNKDTACKAVARLRKKFAPPAQYVLDPTQIRTHSGRQTFVNQLKCAVVADTVGMKMARIADHRPGTP